MQLKGQWGLAAQDRQDSAHRVGVAGRVGDRALVNVKDLARGRDDGTRVHRGLSNAVARLVPGDGVGQDGAARRQLPERGVAEEGGLPGILQLAVHGAPVPGKRVAVVALLGSGADSVPAL